MTKTLRQTAFLFECAVFTVTWISLFALPVVGSVWWAATTFPSLGSNTVVLSLDMTIYADERPGLPTGQDAVPEGAPLRR